MDCEILSLRHLPVFLLLFLTVGEVRHASCSFPSHSGGNGTTPNFTTIFVSQCQRFQKENPDQFENDPKNCTLLLQLFLKSFANKTECNVQTDDYRDFLNAANHTASIPNKALFWAYVSPFVYEFSDSEHGRYTTILNLLSGYILDGLTWCWDLTKRDLNYDYCRPYKECPNEATAVRSFWKLNSQNLANLATGTVYAMLNGSLENDTRAFTNKSLFYLAEVPAMSSPRITEMQVILVQNLNGPDTETCRNGTIPNLRTTMTSKGIAFCCTENPDAVKKLLCRLHPEDAKYCSSATSILQIPLTSLLCRSIVFLFVTKFLQQLSAFELV